MKTIEILENGKYRARIWEDGGMFIVNCFKVENDGQVVYFFRKIYKKFENAKKQAQKFFDWANEK